MNTTFPLLKTNWLSDRNARGYGFLLCDDPLSKPHHHGFFELGYLLKGTMEHTFKNTVTHLEPGDIYFIDIGQQHSYTASQDYQLLNFMFYPQILDPALKKATSLAQIVSSPTFRFNTESLPLLNRLHFHDSDGSLLRHLEEIQQEIQEKKPGHHQMEQTMIQQLVIKLMRIDYTAQTEAANHPMAQQLLQLLDANYAGTLTLKGLANQLGYSSVHLSREFKHIFGTSFTEYLQRLRLAKSCKFLIETDWPIDRVAAAVGYDSVQFYHRLFKRIFQTTPLQYRKSKKLF